MIYLTCVFIAIAVTIALYTFLLLPKSKYPWSVNIAFITVLIVLYSGFVLELGKAKPIEIEFNPMPENVKVIAATWVEGEAIYLWVQLNKPIAYVLPWDEETARNLQGTQEAMKETGELMVDGLFDNTKDAEVKFYEKPIEKYPEKTIIP